MKTNDYVVFVDNKTNEYFKQKYSSKKNDRLYWSRTKKLSEAYRVRAFSYGDYMFRKHVIHRLEGFDFRVEVHDKSDFYRHRANNNMVN